MFTHLSLECIPCLCLELHDLAVNEALRLRLLELHVVIPDVGLQQRASHLKAQDLLVVLLRTVVLITLTTSSCFCTTYLSSHLMFVSIIVLFPDDRLHQRKLSASSVVFQVLFHAA